MPRCNSKSLTIFTAFHTEGQSSLLHTLRVEHFRSRTTLPFPRDVFGGGCCGQSCNTRESVQHTRQALRTAPVHRDLHRLVHLQARWVTLLLLLLCCCQPLQVGAACVLCLVPDTCGHAPNHGRGKGIGEQREGRTLHIVWRGCGGRGGNVHGCEGCSVVCRQLRAKSTGNTGRRWWWVVGLPHTKPFLFCPPDSVFDDVLHLCTGGTVTAVDVSQLLCKPCIQSIRVHARRGWG